MSTVEDEVFHLWILFFKLVQATMSRSVIYNAITLSNRTGYHLVIRWSALFYQMNHPIFTIHNFESNSTGIFFYFLYISSEVWEGIWNQTHSVVLNFCLYRSHRLTISHDKASSNRWCQ